MDKATPTPSPATAEPFKFKNAALLNRLSEMAQAPYYATACQTLIQAEMAIVELERENATLRAEVERLAAQAAPTGNSNGETKLWLWKNFVGGSPEYWAFDNPYPINLDNGDPQTLGEPCGYAIFKPSRSGRPDFSEDEVLLRIAQAESKVSYNLEPNNAEADAFDFLRFAKKNLDMHAARVPFAYNGLVTAAVAWIQAAETILAAQSPAQAPVVQAAQATEKSNWWCAHCGVFVMPVEVTFTERHDPEAGGCGFSVSASSGAAQAVRMLTQEELEHCRLWYDGALNQQLGVLRKFCEVNAGRTIPADGVIGGV